MITNNDATIGYHTQENRGVILTEPIKCKGNRAWLGDGFYFWIDINDAEKWGVKSKDGNYCIYSATLDISNTLNAFSSEKGIRFWEEKIKKVKDKIKTEKLYCTLTEVNSLLCDLFWKKLGITGIIIADRPYEDGSQFSLPVVFNRQRVQIVMFRLDTVADFKFLKHN